MVPVELVRSCLYNWLGYGMVDSPIWFIGTEEGGAEIWREQTQTLKSSLELRSNFGIAMDFYYVWENLYGINLRNFKGITVWHYISSFILGFENMDRSSESIRKFIFKDKKLGRSDSSHFLCELLPLPKRTKASIDDYAHIWKSIKDYHSEVLPKRFELINNSLVQSEKVKLLVSYESTLTQLLLSYYQKKELINRWIIGKQKYTLYMLSLKGNRIVYLLATPFFGQGQASYDGINYVVNQIKDLLNNDQ